MAINGFIKILFDIPYEAEYQGEGTGSALHIYNESGEEVLTYTQGVGRHEKETKDMSLDEYKAYFNDKMDALYTHPSSASIA